MRAFLERVHQPTVASVLSEQLPPELGFTHSHNDSPEVLDSVGDDRTRRPAGGA